MLAKAQYYARLQSEEVNRNLKAILANQIQVGDSLKKILKNRGTLEVSVIRAVTVDAFSNLEFCVCADTDISQRLYRYR